MKISDEFKIRDIAGERTVIMQGRHGADMTRIVALNDTAEWLARSLRGREFTVEEAAALLTARYDVEPARASLDAERWVRALADCGLIEM